MSTSCLNDLCTVKIGGLTLRVRPVHPDDRKALIEGFDSLSAESRWFRFLSPLRELPEKLVRQLTEIDHDDHEAWLAAVEAGDGPHPVAVARYVRDEQRPQQAEIAITVLDDYHRHGIGRMLLFVLAESAAAHDVATFSALVHGDNQPMRRFLSALGGVAVGFGAGSINFTINVADIISQLSGAFKFEPFHA